MIKLILFVSLIKEIIFSAVVPIWHTPDEQAHFAQVAYFAEFGKMPKSGPDLNQEIYEAENLLGTLRDDRGNNKFTYHPEYRMEYTKSLTGKYENQIKSFPKEYRTQLIKQESANYPPLYYWASTIPYKIFYNWDLITRVFAVRTVSVLFGTALVFVAWFLSKELFPKNLILQLTLPILVSFHPMLTFILSGVSSDNLFNLLFATLLYLSILVVKKGLSGKILLTLILLMTLLYLTKPQFIAGITIFAGAIVTNWILSKKKFKILLSIGLLALLIVFGSLVIFNQAVLKLIEALYPQSYTPGHFMLGANLMEFLQFTVQKTFRETIPWYWGVFNWLGIVYPIEVIRILNRIMIIAGIGLIIKLFLMIKNRSREDLYLIFLIFSSVTYFAAIHFYNYLFFSRTSFSFGIQGRYFFPTIVAHMAILLVGLITLVPRKFKMMATKLIGISMVLLNFIALWVIAKSYYDISSFNSFIMQASQYKPEIYKGGFLIAWFLLYFSSLIIFVIKYLRLPVKLNEK